jgi:hypothetical protein
MNKKISWVVLFFLLFSLFNSLFTAFVSDSVAVADDTVVWENEYGKLEVYPATSQNLLYQEQWANITWYYPDNTIDVAFRFNDSLDYGLIEYWNGASWNKVQMSHTTFNNKHYYYYQGFNVQQDTTYRFHWEYYTPPMSSGKWDLIAKLSSDTIQEAFSSGRYILLDPWWNSNWGYKKTLTIDNTQVAGGSNLENFPVLVYRATDSDLASHAQSDGGDIVFVDSTESVQFNHEIENYTTATGELWAWVNVTSISHDTDTVFYMYYGNPGVGNQWDTDGTWDNNYTFVSHMNDSTSNIISDSTVNNNTGQKNHTDQPVETTSGNTDNAQDFEKDDYSYIELDNNWGKESNITVECWFKPESDGIINDLVFEQYDTANYGEMSFQFRVDASDRLNWKTFGDSGPLASCISDGDVMDAGFWYYFTGTWNGGVGGTTAYSYVNGTQDKSSSGGLYYLGDHALSTLNIGCEQDATKYINYADGIIDEVRLSDCVRSPSWIETTWNTIANKTSFITVGGELGQDIDPPEDFVAETDSSDGSMDISWTMGTNNTHTHIERNTISSWTRGDGTLVYNDTGTTHTDNGLSCNVEYFYSAWGFNDSTHTFSSAVITRNISCPGNPSGITTTVYDSALNITWTNNTWSDNTIIVRKSNSYPTSPSDGTELFNGTLLYHNDTTMESTHFYRLFSWNDTVHRFSSGINAPFGHLTINVFDENTSTAIENWDVFITNSDKTQTYESLQNSNPLTIDVGELPYGDNTMIKINATWYDPKIYYMDIALNNHYTLDAYLGNSNDTESYIIRVIDENEEGVSGAKVRVMRYINDTEGYQNISILLTDGYGYCPSVNLIPGEAYAVNITKTNFDSAVYDLNPISIDFEVDRYHTFTIFYSGEDLEIDTFHNTIVFCKNTKWETSNDTLHIDFFDKLGETTDITITVYEFYNNTLVQNASYSYSNTNDINIWVSGLNTSRMHQVKIVSMNHTTLGNFVNVSCYVNPLYVDDDTRTIDELETKFSNSGGDFKPGYVEAFILAFPTFLILVGIGKLDPGFAVLVAGFYLSLASYQINLLTLETAIMAIVGLALPLGIMAIIITRGKRIA